MARPGEILLLEVGYDEITLARQYLVLRDQNYVGVPVFEVRMGEQIGTEGRGELDRYFQLPPAREVR